MVSIHCAPQVCVFRSMYVTVHARMYVMLSVICWQIMFGGNSVLPLTSLGTLYSHMHHILCLTAKFVRPHGADVRSDMCVCALCCLHSFTQILVVWFHRYPVLPSIYDRMLTWCHTYSIKRIVGNGGNIAHGVYFLGCEVWRRGIYLR